jgi:predicted O-methyltransferase YrrM
MKNALKHMRPVEGKSWSSCSSAVSELLRICGPLRIIEIGTSYGYQLGRYSGADRLVCIDTMYDWVPDVRDDEGFDPSRVDQRKLDTWRQNLDEAGLSDRTELVIANSYEAFDDQGVTKMLEGSDVLVIDGCHAPMELVLKDYQNYKKFMNNPHYVVWDDVNKGPVREAADSAERELREQGADVELRDYELCRVFFVEK